jgi:hypothetical protein
MGHREKGAVLRWSVGEEGRFGLPIPTISREGATLHVIAHAVEAAKNSAENARIWTLKPHNLDYY